MFPCRTTILSRHECGIVFGQQFPPIFAFRWCVVAFLISTSNKKDLNAMRAGSDLMRAPEVKMEDVSVACMVGYLGWGCPGVQ